MKKLTEKIRKGMKNKKRISNLDPLQLLELAILAGIDKHFKKAISLINEAIDIDRMNGKEDDALALQTYIDFINENSKNHEEIVDGLKFALEWINKYTRGNPLTPEEELQHSINAFLDATLEVHPRSTRFKENLLSEKERIKK